MVAVRVTPLHDPSYNTFNDAGKSSSKTHMCNMCKYNSYTINLRWNTNTSEWEKHIISSKTIKVRITKKKANSFWAFTVVSDQFYDYYLESTLLRFPNTKCTQTNEIVIYKCSYISFNWSLPQN